MNRYRAYFLVGLLGLVAAFAIPLSNATAQNFVNPGANAPGGSLAPPLNASDSIQRKRGTLTIGPESGPAAVLCLNPAAGSVLNTSNADCISSWSGLTEPLGGPFVRLRTTELSGNPQQPASYGAPDPGYARIWPTDYNFSTGAGQTFSTVTFATGACYDQDTGGLCALNSGSGNCRCAYSGNGCRVNNECTYNGALGTTTAVYASDAGNSSNYAGYFAGRVLVQGTALGGPGFICLNGSQAVTHCVSSWDQVGNTANVAYVRLQLNPPAEQQLGGAAISGVGQFGSIIAGDSSGLSEQYTCGDGLCIASETDSCPIDCAAITPLQQFQIGTAGPTVTLQVRTSGSNPASPVHVLIVRSEDAPPNFVPQAGVAYTAGQQIGNSTVVYATQTSANTTLPIVSDPGVVVGPTYYYHGYQANAYPRYSSPSLQTIQLVQLTLTKTTYADKFTASGPNFDCLFNCTTVVSYHARDANIQLVAEIFLIGYTLDRWTGDCVSTAFECNLTMNGNKTVFVSAKVRPGGGPGTGPPRGD